VSRCIAFFLIFAANILIKQSKQSKKIMAELADNRVKLYPDGKYRWVYEVPMLKNSTILIDVPEPKRNQ
jgi:hypothetical protein